MILSILIALNEEEKQGYRTLSQEEIKKLVEGQNGSGILHLNENQTQFEEQQQIEQPQREVQFFGATYAHFISKPHYNENQTSNSETQFFFDGPARNAAETFAKISEKPVQLMTLIGNDSLGQVLKENLQQIGIDCQNVNFDEKAKTSILLDLQLNNSEIQKKLGSVNEENNTKKEFQTIQFNFDSIYKLAYKYLYPKFNQLRRSDLIYSDMLVNQNAIKALINNFSQKLILHFSGLNNVEKYQQTIQDLNKQYVMNQSGKKNKQQFTDYLQSKRINTVALNIKEYIMLLNTSRQYLSKQSYYLDILNQIDKLNATELLLLNYNQQKSKKESYSDYLIQQKDNIQQLFNLSLQLLNCDRIILFISPIHTIYADRSGLVTFTQHSCKENCIKYEQGSEEAFIAGFIAGLYENDEVVLENVLEKAAYTQISSLKSNQSVNNNLSNKLLNNYQQKYYVSYKEICSNQSQDQTEQTEQKSEL